MSLRTRWKRGDRFLVRHKDADIVVVEKRAGLLSVKADEGEGPDLISLLRGFLGGGRHQAPLFPVHRLDRPVSGLLVVARNFPAKERLVEQFAAHSVDRRYLATVHGRLLRDSGTFVSLLSSSARTLKMRSGPSGRRAVTHWKVLERFEAANATLVEVRLETGLRNQIRVQFAESGFPLLGEKKYARKKTREDGAEDEDAEDEAKAIQGKQRLFLHAFELGFLHPRTRKKMTFTCKLPPDLVSWKVRLATGRLTEHPPRPKSPQRQGTGRTRRR